MKCLSHLIALYSITLLLGSLATTSLFAKDFVRVEPISGMQETLRMEIAERRTSVNRIEEWLIDSFRYRSIRRPNKAYVSSREWRTFAATFQTDEFRKSILDEIDPLIKAEQQFRDALKTSGLAQRVLAEGKLVISFPKGYTSMSDKPRLSELLLPSIAAMVHGYSSPLADQCEEKVSCLITVNFIPGSLEPEVIDIDVAAAPLPLLGE